MITYRINDRIYINLTNRCSNACEFCVRIDDKYSDFNLWLEKEPTAEEIIAELGEMEGASEIVFCGYGEPLYRLDAIIPVSEYAHNKGKKTRINTNGQARHIAGEGVAQKLAGYIDTVSISLNAGDAKVIRLYATRSSVSRPSTILLISAGNVKSISPVWCSPLSMSLAKNKSKKARKIAEEVGAELRIRRYI